MAKKTSKPAARAGHSFERYKIAVLVPCYNEEAAIGKAVRDFRAALPQATVFVYDNNSTDQTAEQPLSLFRGIGLTLGMASLGFAIPIFIIHFETGLVSRLPTTVRWTGLMMLAFLSIAVGLILDTVTRGRREAKLFACLSHRAPCEEHRRG